MTIGARPGISTLMRRLVFLITVPFFNRLSVDTALFEAGTSRLSTIADFADSTILGTIMVKPNQTTIVATAQPIIALREKSGSRT